MIFPPYQFDKLNEADIREEIIAPLLKHLGYSTGTENDVNREQSLTYPKEFLGRKKKTDPILRGRADYICNVQGQINWVLEAKAPDTNLDIDAAEQSWTYANHPQIHAVYFCLCNGLVFKIFQTNRGASVEPIFQCNYENMEESLATIYNILSPQAILRDHPTHKVSTRVLIGPDIFSHTSINARILFPPTDFANLEADVGCRWGLWRHCMLGLLSGPDAAFLLHVLNDIEKLLTQAISNKNICQPLLRHWHIMDAASLTPPRDLNDLPAPIRGNLQSEPQKGQKATLLGLIVNFAAPKPTILPAKDRRATTLTAQLSAWVTALIGCLPEVTEPAIICLIHGSTVAELQEAAHRLAKVAPQNIPVEFLQADPLTYGHDQIFEAWLSPPSANGTEMTEGMALEVFTQLLETKADYNTDEINNIPSVQQLVEALGEIREEEDQRIRFWKLLNHVEISRPLLLEPLVYRAACCKDSILADVALRFAKRDDRLLDSWLEARKSSAPPFIPSSLTYIADPTLGGAFVDELALGLARMIRNDSDNQEALEWLESLQDYVSPPLKLILNDYVLTHNYPLPILTTNDAEKILLAYRSGCLNDVPSELFPLDVENPFPFWLLLARRPNLPWLLHILAQRCPERSAFGLTTSQEQQKFYSIALLNARIGECRNTPAIPSNNHAVGRNCHAG